MLSQKNNSCMLCVPMFILSKIVWEGHCHYKKLCLLCRSPPICCRTLANQGKRTLAELKSNDLCSQLKQNWNKITTWFIFGVMYLTDMKIEYALINACWSVVPEKQSYFSKQAKYIFVVGQLRAWEIMKNIKRCTSLINLPFLDFQNLTLNFVPSKVFYRYFHVG